MPSKYILRSHYKSEDDWEKAKQAMYEWIQTHYPEEPNKEPDPNVEIWAGDEPWDPDE